MPSRARSEDAPERRGRRRRRSRAHLDRPDGAAKARRHRRAPRDGPAGRHVQEIRTRSQPVVCRIVPGWAYESVTASRRIAMAGPRRREGAAAFGKWSEWQDLNLRPPRPERERGLEHRVIADNIVRYKMPLL